MNLITNNKSESEILIALIGLGICNGLQDNYLDLEVAENILFCPYNLEKLKKLKINQQLLDAIHLGMELNNVKRLIPESYERSLLEIQKKFQNILQVNKNIKLPNSKWLQ